MPIESKCQHRFVFATGNTSQGLSFRDLDGTKVGSITPCNSNRFDSTAQWKLFPTSGAPQGGTEPTMDAALNRCFPRFRTYGYYLLNPEVTGLAE